MSEESNAKLKQKIKQTEMAVTSVAQILQDKENQKTPPAMDAMPIPRPAQTVKQPPQNLEEGASETEKPSDTDELQSAWLVSLDTKTNLLNECLSEIQSALALLSENVEHLEAEARIKNAEADGKLADNVLRKEMADRTYIFMVFWCLFIGSLMTGYVIAWEGKPPTEFMLGLLGTCTISIIGLVGFVVSGLFKAPTKKDE